jgi:hypothetical protein
MANRPALTAILTSVALVSAASAATRPSGLVDLRSRAPRTSGSGRSLSSVQAEPASDGARTVSAQSLETVHLRSVDLQQGRYLYGGGGTCRQLNSNLWPSLPTQAFGGCW